MFLITSFSAISEDLPQILFMELADDTLAILDVDVLTISHIINFR